MTYRILLALIVSLAFLTGCSRDGKPGVTTLRLVAWGNEKEEKNFRSLIADFEKSHPGIKVELQITPYLRVFDKLMISTAGGRPPDVSRVSSTWFHPCAAKGLFEDLDPYVKKDKDFDLSDFYPQTIDAWGKYNGKLYCIPTDIDICAMYYNKELFDKSGIPYPDWSWDWDKYLEVAKKLSVSDSSGKRIRWGTATNPFWESYVYQNCGTVLSDDLKRCTLNEPAAYKALQWESDLINKYHVVPTAEDIAQVSALKLFEAGKIAMFISGSWCAELQLEKDKVTFPYDVAPLPKGKKRVSFFGGAAYAVMSRSKNKDAAWELVKWMTGPEYQRRGAINSQIIPSRRSVAESGAYLGLNRPPRDRKIFLDMIPYGQADPPVSVSPEMKEIMSAEISLVLLDKKKAKPACEKLKPVIDQLLRHQE
jgi:multiple sugar transport system substrate-binding protein